MTQHGESKNIGKCAAAEQVNRSPKYVCCLFFHSHLLLFTIFPPFFGAVCRQQNKTEQDYWVPRSWRGGGGGRSVCCCQRGRGRRGRRQLDDNNESHCSILVNAVVVALPSAPSPSANGPSEVVVVHSVMRCGEYMVEYHNMVLSTQGLPGLCCHILLSIYIFSLGSYVLTGYVSSRVR
jgi:hypothetical protein